MRKGVNPGIVIVIYLRNGVVPRYFQWVAVAPKMGKRLGGFLSQPGLILGVDSNCFGGHEKRPGCVKKVINRIEP